MMALDTIQKVRRATATVMAWDAALATQVVDLAPDFAKGRNLDWAVSVELFRRPNEQVINAATRLAQYVTAYAERHGKPPSLHRLLEDNERE